jgi:fused signal recognition particle receptor
MVFNWFRRKFDRSEAEDSAPPALDGEQTSASEIESGEAETAAETTATPTEKVDTDYLVWAKAAYQNIQQQQATAQPEVAVVEPIADLEPATIPATDTPEQVDTPTVETIITEPVSEPIVADETVNLGVETTSGEPQEIDSVDENIPIWARDDRQQRIERLKATAIETVEPAAPAVDIELDDEFLWSAKVLADLGRTPEQVSIDEINWLKKLRQGLDKTRRGFINQFKALIGQGPLNAEAVESIETLLLQADVGVEATDYVIETLQAKLRQESLPPEEALAYLKQILRDLLDQPYQANYVEEFMPVKDTLNIWLFVGVNGVGKTTTIGKLAHMTQTSGYQCLIAAGDTFRAAAVEQVKVWGQRSGIDVIANPGQNTDPAAVVFDAISAAQSRGTELLLVDTAGRLQNKKNLMDELSKIRRIVDKQASGAQIESLLVLDATLGQNGLRQAQVFAEAAKLSGVVLTKLDGTAKGGVALAVVQQLGLPIRFIGAGEGIEDLRPFSSYEFVEALLSG